MLSILQQRLLFLVFLVLEYLWWTGSCKRKRCDVAIGVLAQVLRPPRGARRARREVAQALALPGHLRETALAAAATVKRFEEHCGLFRMPQPGLSSVLRSTVTVCGLFRMPQPVLSSVLRSTAGCLGGPEGKVDTSSLRKLSPRVRPRHFRSTRTPEKRSCDAMRSVTASVSARSSSAIFSKSSGIASRTFVIFARKGA